MSNIELVPVCEPGPRPLLISDPFTLTLAYELSFSKKIREFWMGLVSWKDQTMIYSEERGWQVSGEPAQELDHITPEAQLRFEGKDPYQETGVPRSKRHHTGPGRESDGQIAPHGSPNWSRHPDMHAAKVQYAKGDKQAINKALDKHQEAVRNGQEFTNDDWSLREYYRDIMEQKAWEHYLATGEKRPASPKKRQ